MRTLLSLLLFSSLSTTGCLVAVDDPWVDVGPPERGRGGDGAADAGAEDADPTDGGETPQLDAFWPFEHAPEDCPEEAARASEVCDPRCDGVSHFYCAEQPNDPCCACLRLGGGGQGGGGGGQGGGQGGGGGGGQAPPLPPPPR